VFEKPLLAREQRAGKSTQLGTPVRERFCASWCRISSNFRHAGIFSLHRNSHWNPRGLTVGVETERPAAQARSQEW